MRANFSNSTRQLVAERAGYKCSFPTCGRITIGPAIDPHKSVNSGIAAHIYGAALSGQGPRGSGRLSKSELESPQNAIWLCAHHSTLIDKNQGSDFPPGILHSYKALHETRIAHEVAGIHTPFGWVHNFTVESSPLFSHSFRIDLAKLNLIVGENSVGKTALCEWIAGVSDPKYFERWEEFSPDNLRPLCAGVEYFNPNRHSIEVDLSSNQYPRYKLDGEETYVSTNSVRVTFPESIEPLYQETPNDLETVVNSIKLHPYEIRALCDQLKNNSDLFAGAHFERSEEGTYMHVQVNGKTGIEERLLSMLASSERERLMMELGIIAANKLSMTGPSILILDANSWQINTKWLERYGEFLGSPACRFQTIASTRSTDIDFGSLAWAGWKVIALDGVPPNASVATGVGKAP